MVGPRERVVLVEVGDTWLLLGVAPEQREPAAHLPKPPQSAPSEPRADAAPGFRRALLQALGQARQEVADMRWLPRC